VGATATWRRRAASGRVSAAGTIATSVFRKAYQSVRSRSTHFGQVGCEPEQGSTTLRPAFNLGFLSSVLKRSSHQVRRESASGERFLAISASGQSTGLPRKPQETCHSAPRLVRRRARLVWELAEEVRPDTNGLSQRRARCARIFLNTDTMAATVPPSLTTALESKWRQTFDGPRIHHAGARASKYEEVCGS